LDFLRGEIRGGGYILPLELQLEGRVTRKGGKGGKTRDWGRLKRDSSGQKRLSYKKTIAAVGKTTEKKKVGGGEEGDRSF